MAGDSEYLIIPFLYDIPADSDVIKQLQSLAEPADFVVPLPVRATKSILTHLNILFRSVSEYTADDVVAEQRTSTVLCLNNLPPRWYPVIDDSRCVGCLECVNFCLFGVYSIGKDDRPLVDQPAACRDGCPACSRVCPGRAIMFPLYEDRQIAGYDDVPADELDNLTDLVDTL
ncbi:hypothetical protein FACS1894170_09790 [Planctomycetales bacterium]|nr:hypothetical protein FACS1894170_09790 [Planctomycetales bacterium]